MKGTDLTETQIQHAREFIAARQKGNACDVVVDDAASIAIRFGDLARLVAWYGAIRFEAGSRGGSLENPGKVVVKDA